MNADKAKEVGGKILREDTEFDGWQECAQLLIPKKDQVITLASKTAVRFVEGTIQVDPQLLFQRLTIAATGGRYEDPKSMFKYEMCNYPPALFDTSHLPRKANKLALTDAILPIQRPIKQLNLQETSILSLMEVLSCTA